MKIYKSQFAIPQNQVPNMIQYFAIRLAEGLHLKIIFENLKKRFSQETRTFWNCSVVSVTRVTGPLEYFQ